MKIISLCLQRIFLTAIVFLLTELQDLGHTVRMGVQDQNQGRPRTMRTHCGWMGWAG